MGKREPGRADRTSIYTPLHNTYKLSSEMGVVCDDAITIKVAEKPGDTTLITINCPDKTGLGCDLCRIILEFGLRINAGDISTDGRWCYVVIWVLSPSGSTDIRWDSLKNRLLSLCPSSLPSYYYNLSSKSPMNPIYLLKVFCLDRKGLLHDVTRVLCELELSIQKVKVSTTPDGKVVDLFFITDGKESMHTKERQEETCLRLNDVLGEAGVRCELQQAGPEYESFRHGSCFASTIFEGLFSSDIPKDGIHLQGPDLTKVRKASINIDNSLSPAHTLLQIHSADQKGLLYDILRAIKDCNIQISYGRFLSDKKGFRDIDVFIQQNDGKKLVDPQLQEVLCSRLRTEILHPLRMLIINRGPDTELMVANPVELSGKGRPRVFYDVTLALKTLGICIFSAEICRHSTPEWQWEVYRFLLDDSTEFPLIDSTSRNRILDTVRKILMGW